MLILTVVAFQRDIFSLGFGPFRWVCTSGLEEDLKKTDEAAAEILRELSQGTMEKLSASKGLKLTCCT